MPTCFFRFTGNTRPKAPRCSSAALVGWPSLEPTGEMARILALPTAAQGATDGATWLRAIPRPWRGQIAPRTLLPAQGRALAAALAAPAPRGLLAPIGVGHGKTLLSLLLPAVWQSQRPLILLPAKLKRATVEAVDFWGTSWEFPRPKVESFEKLSRPEATEFLDAYRPDVIVCDEAHALRSGDSSRTKRMERYLSANPDTRVALLSGSFTTSSIKDFAHLSEWALREGSPLPLEFLPLELLASVLDPEKYPDNQALAFVCPLVAAYKAPGDTFRPLELRARSAFKTRFNSAPGVVCTSEASCEAPLRISGVTRRISQALQNALDTLAHKWETPDGELVVDSLEHARASRSLALGFYRRLTVEVTDEYKEARKKWAKWLRYALRGNCAPGLDSPALICAAAERGELDTRGTWAAWDAVRGQYGPGGPPTEAIWICGEAVEWAIAHATAAPRLLVWYSSRAVGAALADAGLRRYGEGSWPPGDAVSHAALSIRVHGTGRNLQAWTEHLVLEPPANGATWEQLLGRSHRTGQTRPVNFRYLSNPAIFRESFDKACTHAEFDEQTTGQKKRLNHAEIE